MHTNHMDMLFDMNRLSPSLVYKMKHTFFHIFDILGKRETSKTDNCDKDSLSSPARFSLH